MTASAREGLGRVAAGKRRRAAGALLNNLKKNDFNELYAILRIVKKSHCTLVLRGSYAQALIQALIFIFYKYIFTLSQHCSLF